MVQHLSEEWVALHAEVGKDLPERPGASARLQHVVTGTPHGEVAYTIQITDGRVTAATLGREDDAADCTFLEPYDEAVQLAKGELDLHVGFMRGRLKMSGSSGALLDVLACTQSPEYRHLVTQVAGSTTF